MDEEMVCQHCDEACWLKEDPCAMAEMKKRMEGEATVERDSLEAFFLRLLLLDNIKQEAQVHCQLLKRVQLCCYVLTGFASLNIFLPELCFKVNIQEEAKSTGPKESETDELSVGVAQNGHFKPRQPR